MAPRQDIIIQPNRIRIEQSIPPPPPAPGRLQRPPHDHPATYIDRQNARRNNTSNTQTPLRS
ncbi:unnamed protein product [Leptidea sinapis]|uniref:Uncharacterized protein n=1 Tax=Leptidea sinapis TaxID=189913 RepID=A0A5E4QHV1_9NEOP|nr:unnamed protein product [Leptidea sinapis]